MRSLLRKVLPRRAREAYRSIVQKSQRRRLLASMPPEARDLYIRSTLTSYEHVRLTAEATIARAAVEAAARSVIGEQWNYYSDALRVEIVEGFVRTLDGVEGSGPLDYLEIGSCQGLSMSLIGLLLRGRSRLSSLTSIDPYFSTGYEEGGTGPYRQRIHVQVDKTTRDRAQALYRLLGLHVELLEKPSVDGLGDLLSRQRKFDVIYIDGSHERLWPAVDFGMSCALLREGGIIILDDHLWPDVEPIRKLCDRHAMLVQSTWKTASYRINLTG